MRYIKTIIVDDINISDQATCENCKHREPNPDNFYDPVVFKAFCPLVHRSVTADYFCADWESEG